MAKYIVNIDKIDDFNKALKKQIDDLNISINSLIDMKEKINNNKSSLINDETIIGTSTK